MQNAGAESTDQTLRGARAALLPLEDSNAYTTPHARVTSSMDPDAPQPPPPLNMAKYLLLHR